uniref:Uncharacterized protein n=1 Tax=Micrurus lemniscatus lemniscatus TaxID=129467 RepID=A0A2D4JKK1_MICLE
MIQIQNFIRDLSNQNQTDFSDPICFSIKKSNWLCTSTVELLLSIYCQSSLLYYVCLKTYLPVGNYTWRGEREAHSLLMPNGLDNYFSTWMGRRIEICRNRMWKKEKNKNKEIV